MFFLRDVVEKQIPGAVAYRYCDRRQAHGYYDYDGECTGISHYTTHIDCQEWEVCGFTPKGFYIRCGMTMDAKKWIGHGWRKKFAHLNQADAQKSFIKRKQSQIRILNAQLGAAEIALQAAQSGHWDGKCPPIIHELFKGKIKLDK